MLPVGVGSFETFPASVPPPLFLQLTLPWQACFTATLGHLVLSIPLWCGSDLLPQSSHKLYGLEESPEFCYDLIQGRPQQPHLWREILTSLLLKSSGSSLVSHLSPSFRVPYSTQYSDCSIRWLKDPLNIVKRQDRLMSVREEVSFGRCSSGKIIFWQIFYPRSTTSLPRPQRKSSMQWLFPGETLGLLGSLASPLATGEGQD